MVTKIEGLPQTENIPPEVVAAMNNAGAQNVQTPNGGATISTQWNAKGMTSTVTQCITNENVYPNAQTSSDCERTQQKDGNTYRFHVICNRGGDQTEETSSFTYTGDTMNGVATIHGKEVNTTTQFTGKYIGPCQ